MTESKSISLFEKAQTLMPGGVNSPVRAYRAVHRTPRFIKSANGSKITDADGNTYIDYVCTWGPALLGHAFPAVVKAVQKAAVKGLSYGAPTEGEVKLAHLVSSLMPPIQMLRLVSSGTEAVMSAIRVARGYTGRNKIIKFKGCYHGHSDSLLVKAGSAALTCASPDSAGVPKGCTQDTLVALYNDQESVKRLFEANKGEVAAIIVEPVAANMGVVLPQNGFLEFLRDITKREGSLLIFDEVITGFRLAPGGASERFGITPDLVTLGKIIGGGMPVGAYGGRREIMQQVSPLGSVYQAGTLSGNPVSVAAGLATLEYLASHKEIYSALEDKTNRLATAYRNAFGKQVCVNNIASLMSVFFTAKPVTNYETASSSDTERYAEYFNFMLDNGIYLAPSQFEAMFISAAHSDEDIEKTISTLQKFTQV
ncbi:glutamate-1-semialdehyde 2,1-aminomutase [Treponema zioleckii]|uniref:glutamate-1-semialdehyde 2,1-aminomutase n=1 Tax=Treponema zioleckii TaxID=331680 RepID=UPI00168B7524|nr:glutamate-1-semialdehyde 2,1-aminomutase [Treponema zioleckii]